MKNEGALVTSKKKSMQNHMFSTEIKFSYLKTIWERERESWFKVLLKRDLNIKGNKLDTIYVN